MLSNAGWIPCTNINELRCQTYVSLTKRIRFRTTVAPSNACCKPIREKKKITATDPLLVASPPPHSSLVYDAIAMPLPHLSRSIGLIRSS